MKKEDLKKLLNLGETIDVFKVEEKIEKGLMIKFVHVKSNKKKARCTKCFTFSNKVHDYLKPSKITYLKNSGSNTYLIVYKRRFECKKCNKSFTEDLEISNKGCKISNKTKQMILKQCLERDKTIKSIAEENNISEDIVRTTFLEAMKNYPSNVELLPSVISFDEVATHTRAGLYSFVLNDPIHKITLDILKTRKKEYLIEYFSKVKNRYSVKVVICDLYKPYYEVVKICFPNAIFVADPFHYTRYIEEGLDKVRIRLMHQYEIDKKSYEYKMLKNRNNRKLLLRSFNETKGEKKKREEQTKKYEQGIIKNKPKDKFNDYWYGKMKIKKNNKFIEIYRIDRLQELLDINETLVDAYTFKDDKYSNGFTEANNNTIGKIIDRGYGYKNFEFFRLRALAILHKSYSNDIRKNSKNDEFRNGIFFKNN